MRSSAFALAKEVRAARRKRKPHDGEASRRGGGQEDQEEGILAKHKENAQSEDTKMWLLSEEPVEAPPRTEARSPADKGLEGQANSTSDKNERGTWLGVGL